MYNFTKKLEILLYGKVLFFLLFRVNNLDSKNILI